MAHLRRLAAAAAVAVLATRPEAAWGDAPAPSPVRADEPGPTAEPADIVAEPGRGAGGLDSPADPVAPREPAPASAGDAGRRARARARDARTPEALEPPTMPPWGDGAEAVISVDYLGAVGEVHGVSTLLGYRRPVSPAWSVSGEAGVQWAAQGGVDGVSLTNVALGGRYRPAGEGGVALRGAVTLPLASDAGSAALPGALHGALRVADGERFAPGPVTALAAAAYRWDRAGAFAQLEVGALLLARRDARDDLWLQLGVAGGVRAAGPVALVADLSTRAGVVTGPLPAVDGDPPENVRHTLAVGLRAAVPRGSVAARLQVPLDGSFRSRDVFLAGVEYRAGF